MERVHARIVRRFAQTVFIPVATRDTSLRKAVCRPVATHNVFYVNLCVFNNAHGTPGLCSTQCVKRALFRAALPGGLHKKALCAATGAASRFVVFCLPFSISKQKTTVVKVAINKSEANNIMTFFFACVIIAMCGLIYKFNKKL